MSVLERAAALASHHNPGHDETQIRYFIVEGNGVTDYGKWKQAVAEVSTYLGTLKSSMHANRKVLAEMKIIEAEIEELQTKAGKKAAAQVELKELELEEKKLALEANNKQIARAKFELEHFVAIAEEYEKKLEGKDIKALKRDYHVQRLRKMLELTVVSGSNSYGLLETITALPQEMAQPILEDMHKLKTLEVLNHIRYQTEAQKLLQEQGNK